MYIYRRGKTTTGTGRNPQNENETGRILQKEMYITVKWGKYINHAMGKPRVIGRDARHRKYEDSSLRYQGRQ
jgi:hypothetical protein